MFVRVTFAAALVALAGFAGTASATLTLPSSAARAEPMVDTPFQNRVTAAVYSGIPGPYSAFAAATGPVGFDDYASTVAGPFNLAQFKFVGGVTTVGGQLTVQFFDSAQTQVNSFNITLPQAGNFIWTITLGAAPDGSDSTFGVNGAGFVQISAATATTGQWFFTTTAPTIGTNDVAVGGGAQLSPPRNNAFELVNVPAPGSLALVGLGGLVALRRRR